jgi:hypothetical protein
MAIRPIGPIRLFGDPILLTEAHLVHRLDGPATRKLAMRAIREASWSGLAPRPVRVSPHPLGGSARLPDIRAVNVTP